MLSDNIHLNHGHRAPLRSPRGNNINLGMEEDLFMGQTYPVAKQESAYTYTLKQQIPHFAEHSGEAGIPLTLRNLDEEFSRQFAGAPALELKALNAPFPP